MYDTCMVSPHASTTQDLRATPTSRLITIIATYLGAVKSWCMLLTSFSQQSSETGRSISTGLCLGPAG